MLRRTPAVNWFHAVTVQSANVASLQEYTRGSPFSAVGEMKLLNARLLVILLGAIATGSALARGHSGHFAQAGNVGRSGHAGHSPQSARSAPAARIAAPAFHRPLVHSRRFDQRVRIGVFLGAPVFMPWYNPPARYYAYPPVVALPPSLPVYIEQSPAPAAPAQQHSYWYYCPESNAYYPYVTDCPAGWEQVAPQPPPP